MTERELQNFLWADRGQRHALFVPCFTPCDWWECDIWGLTDAGFAVEFEIKLTVADFRADAQKERKFYENKDAPRWEDRYIPTARLKHAMLSGRDPRSPNRFFYVVPFDFPLERVAVPEWAGVLRKNPRGYSFHEEVKAPKLHTQKPSEKSVRQAERCFYYRYWSLRQKFKTEPKESSLTEF